MVEYELATVRTVKSAANMVELSKCNYNNGRFADQHLFYTQQKMNVWTRRDLTGF